MSISAFLWTMIVTVCQPVAFCTSTRFASREYPSSPGVSDSGWNREFRREHVLLERPPRQRKHELQVRFVPGHRVEEPAVGLLRGGGISTMLRWFQFVSANVPSSWIWSIDPRRARRRPT